MAFGISRSLGLLFGLAASFTPALAAAQEDEKPIVEYRHKLMTGQRASMASIGDILKLKLPYSSHIAIHGGTSASIPS